MGHIVTSGGPFNVTPNKDYWTGSNDIVGLTVIASPKNVNPSKRLNDEPALCFVSNEMKPFVIGAPQDQTLIAELNGVFVHIRTHEEKVFVVVADKRMT